jgi:glycogen debranching enzyme
VTKPPVIAWAALKLHASQPNADFLAELYPALVRWNAWWFSKNDSDGDGLVEYVHPYSSGLDDSPLWDHGLPVESPDINTYLSIQMDALATMATTLKLKGEAEYWKHRSKAIVQRMLEDLYDPDMGLFWATHNHEPILELTPFNLYPLWTGQLEPKIVEKLIAHLTNEDAFWGSFPLATVSRSSESYAPETMWRGPVWININYIFIEALERTGHMDLARQLRKRTLSLVAQNDGIYEFYNPEKGSPPERAVPMFGWSAALFIDLVLQRKRRQGES